VEGKKVGHTGWDPIFPWKTEEPGRKDSPREFHDSKRVNVVASPEQRSREIHASLGRKFRGKSKDGALNLKGAGKILTKKKEKYLGGPSIFLGGASQSRGKADYRGYFS